MAIQKKHGKGRLDKWYKLAKEKGYRARAAFKLIQLNRRYSFLEKSKVVLDLCAAPGSWSQVAAECMAPQSIILGVDLVPIKPIPRVTTIQSDIRTDQCRSIIRAHLKNWKVDTVLHDGSPNVGIAFSQDAFSQAELVLQATKLAAELLQPGGTFVTKVFRSKDYNSLVWVFNQLFDKVEATKPPSSRSVSAEIFVVCQGFKAAQRIDPRFLDPRAVFAELHEPSHQAEARVLNPEKKKRKREGYDTTSLVQFEEASAYSFVVSNDPIAMLGSLNRLTFTQPNDGDLALATLEKLLCTSSEIKEYCFDLKTLGRKEFKNLLRWRLKARGIFGIPQPNSTRTQQLLEVAEIKNFDQSHIEKERLQELVHQSERKNKRAKKRENERRRREQKRLQMNIQTPTEIGLEQNDTIGAGPGSTTKNLYTMVHGSAKHGDVEHSSRSSDAGSSSDAEDCNEVDQLDEELELLYETYKQRQQNIMLSVNRGRHIPDSNGKKLGFSSEDSKTSLVPNTAEQSVGQQATFPTSLFDPRGSTLFTQDIFHDVQTTTDSNASSESQRSDRDQNPFGYIVQRADSSNLKVPSRISTSTNSWPYVDTPIYDESRTLSGKTYMQDTHAPSPRSGHALARNLTASEINIITAEAMTLAQQIASGTKTTSDLVDDMYKKSTFFDNDGLPGWFIEDEKKHNIPQKPVTAEAAAAIREKLRALNARPIKKVQEAKARKSIKAAKRLEKLREKSALLADGDSMTERDKARNIAKLLSRAKKRAPRKETSLVFVKRGNKGMVGRPKGVKGRYKLVDSRLKKDARAAKRLKKKIG